MADLVITGLGFTWQNVRERWRNLAIDRRDLEKDSGDVAQEENTGRSGVGHAQRGYSS